MKLVNILLRKMHESFYPLSPSYDKGHYQIYERARFNMDHKRKRLAIRRAFLYRLSSGGGLRQQNPKRTKFIYRFTVRKSILPTRFSDAEVAAISTVISQPRLSRYLAATGADSRRALALYRWNAQISAALMFPLQMCEVSTRNGIVGAIERVYGPNWHVSAAFERSLPNPIRHGPGPSVFSPQRELKQARQGMQTAGKVVAEIKPAFWIAMLTARHDGRLWTPWLKTEFPNFTEPSPEKCRNMLHKEFEEVRKLRNRVAHHEPVFSRNLAADYERMRRIVGWRSQHTADWMHREQSVTALLATRP